MSDKEFSMEEIYPLLCDVINSGGEFRLYPRGTSMLPLLRQGVDSVALVRPEHLCRRDICLYRRESGQFVLHRLMRVEKDGTLTFCGDNQLAFERGIAREAVVARAVACYRGEKRREVTSPRLRLYAFFHCVMFLRWLRFLPRRVWHRLKRTK